MKRSTYIVLTIILCVFASLRASSQVRPVNDYGALGLGHLLNRLQTTASVMMIGAHPDDEDSALLAYLARGENARTAYLSLTRGDGGQNIIGPELGEALGIIRTEELLQARRLDGGEQYFTRAYDYGFSKTLAEAKSKWPEDVIKCDVVRAIRLFRPMVVISRFTGTPADGHGQHQYAGYISPIAVKAAADPKQCSDAGEAWQVLKFYVEQSFSDKTEPTLKINTGQYDPLLGRTYFEIAMEGRSMHRSQGEGRLELHGDQFSGLSLIGTAKPPREKSIFDGLDVKPVFSELLTKRQGRTREAKIEDIAKIFNIATEKVSTPDEGYWSAVRAITADYIKHIGIQIDALADKETVIPGDQFSVSVKVYVAQTNALRVDEITLKIPSGWTATKIDPPKQNSPGFIVREVATANGIFNVQVRQSAPFSEPYWLRAPRDGDLFRWSNTSARTLPFDEQPIVAIVKVKIGESEVTLQQPVQFRYADPARGEVRRDINVVPPISVDADQELVVVPISAEAQTRRVTLNLTNLSPNLFEGSVCLCAGLTNGWSSAPATQDFVLKTRGEKTSLPFELTVPAGQRTGIYELLPAVRYDGGVASDEMNQLTYPHITTHRDYVQTKISILVADLKTAPVKVGYIMGSGDEVPEAIGQMGMDVTMLEEKDLASGDLSRFDTIVVGIRASETRPDLVANNSRLLDYVKNGGTVLMQYQRFAWTGLAPYPVDIQDKQGTTAGSIARVVDENAPVKILEPQHSIFNFPNKITDADFKGWVQERNAYNLVTFDPQYTPLLESHDAGEQENTGGLVIAKVGKGNWVYCSYSFFRQLPAGVPGAYRLFANLLSLPKAR